MKNILIINGHQPYDFSLGTLTQSLIDVATKTLQDKGYTVKHSNVLAYDIAEELEKHQWADAVILQFPSNWMMVPWACKKYMLSTTFNAPKEAFDNPKQYLFQGKSLDDLHFPIHCVYRFFAMEALPSFGVFDVIKNPQIEQDLKDFESHINQYF